MSEEVRGLKRALYEVAYSLVISALFQTPKIYLAQTYTQGQTYVPLFELLIGFFMSVTFIRKMQYWHNEYFAGWFLGIGLMIYSGLMPLSQMGPLDRGVDIAIPVNIWFSRKFRNEED